MLLVSWKDFFFVVVEDLDSGVLAGYGGLGGVHGTSFEC